MADDSAFCLPLCAMIDEVRLGYSLRHTITRPCLGRGQSRLHWQLSWIVKSHIKILIDWLIDDQKSFNGSILFNCAVPLCASARLSLSVTQSGNFCKMTPENFRKVIPSFQEISGKFPQRFCGKFPPTTNSLFYTPLPQTPKPPKFGQCRSGSDNVCSITPVALGVSRVNTLWGVYSWDS